MASVLPHPGQNGGSDEEWGSDSGSQRSSAQRSNAGSATSQHSDHEWKQPELQAARDHAALHIFQYGSNPVCSTKIEALAPLGAGVVLYFRLQACMALVLLLMAAAHIPTFLIAKAGSRVPLAERDSYGFVTLTIANAGLEEAANGNGTTADAQVLDVQGLGPMTAQDASLFVGLCDTVAVIIFIVSVMIFRRSIAVTSDRLDRAQVSAADYTVMVLGLPRDATEEEIHAFFEGLYALSKPDWTSRRCIGGKRRGRQVRVPDAADSREKFQRMLASSRRPSFRIYAEPTLSGEHIDQDESSAGRQAQYDGTWVAEVNVAHPNGALISRYQSIASLSAHVRTAAAQANSMLAQGRLRREQRLRRRVHQLRDQLSKAHHKEADSYSAECVGAFVTFENEESFARCVYDYAHHRHWLCGYPSPLRFRGKHQLTVERAPEPTSVKWENFEVSSFGRCMRQCVVTLVVAVILVASAIGLSAAAETQQRLLQQIPDISVCKSDLPRLAYGGEDFPSSASLVLLGASDAETEGVCAASESYIRWEPTPSDFNATDGNCRGACYGEQAVGTCQVDETTSFPVGTVPACFCLQQLTSAIEALGYTDGLSTVTDQAPICGSFVEDYIKMQGMVLGLSVLVPVLNILLYNLAVALTAAERHATTTLYVRSLTKKLFISMFLNTAIIILLVNARARFMEDLGLGNGLLGVFGGDYKSFTPGWFQTVGYSITFTMVINVISPHAPALVEYYVLGPLLRCLAWRSAVDQDALNEAFKPPPFMLEARFPVVLNTLFVTLMYAPGMPLLLFLGAIAMLVGFWVDKWLLLKMYHRPPLYDADVVQSAVAMLPFAIVIHLAIAVWMYGDPSLLDARPLDEEQYDSWAAGTKQWDAIGLFARVARESALPVFLLLILYAGTWITMATGGRVVSGVLKAAVRLLTCGLLKPVERESTFLPPFTGLYFQTASDKEISEIANSEAEDFEVIENHLTGEGYLKAQSWANSGTFMGRPHLAGERKRTWEYIASATVHTYNIALNPAYAATVQVMHSGLKDSIARKKRDLASAAQTPAADRPAINFEMAATATAAAGTAPGLVGAAAGPPVERVAEEHEAVAAAAGVADGDDHEEGSSDSSSAPSGRRSSATSSASSRASSRQSSQSGSAGRRESRQAWMGGDGEAEEGEEPAAAAPFQAPQLDWGGQALPGQAPGGM